MEIIVVFLMGFLVVGAQAVLNVLVVNYNPASIRITGVGWALGMRRIHSIADPVIAEMPFPWNGGHCRFCFSEQSLHCLPPVLFYLSRLKVSEINRKTA